MGKLNGFFPEMRIQKVIFILNLLNL